MKTFTDNLGRVWSIAINVASIKRVKALCDINILDIITTNKDGSVSADLLERFSNDPVLLVDVLYAVCKPECEQKNVTDEEFGMGLSGDAIENASQALLEDIVDFFPEAKRLIFKKVLAASRRFAEAAKAKMMTELNQLDGVLDSRLQELNGTSTNVPESAE